MDKTKTIAIVAVVIIIVAACAAVGLSKGKSNSDSSFTIVDGKGTEFKFDGPIDGIVSVNTNIPKAMKILGYEDQLKGISFYPQRPAHDRVEIPHRRRDHRQGEGQVCGGSGQIYDHYCRPGEGVQQPRHPGHQAGLQRRHLLRVFGGKDATNAKYDSFNKMYNNVINTVLDKAKGTDFSDKTFLAYFNSGKAFYNQTAVVSNDIEKLYGKNALRSISGLDLSGVTNDATQDGIKENVIKVDGDKPIDKVFFRGSSSTSDTDSAESAWAKSELAKSYSSLSAIDAGEVYVFNSDIMSGAMAFVGFVFYAEIIGIDTGYNVADLVEQYNTTYGFNENTTGLAFQIVDGEATEIVVE